MNIENESMADKCRGLIFRCARSQYLYSENGKIIWGDKTTMKMSKKLSCLGCKHCEFLLEDLNESLGKTNIEPDIIHGALYQLSITDLATDQDGVPDYYNVVFIKL